MASSFKAIRGMHDMLPDKTPLWQYLEQQIKTVLGSYGYQEIRLPLLEETRVFHRSIGDVTDIVEKEMYSFADRNQESLTLRPEGTAGCVRACIEHGLLFHQQQRLWYTGPMFRYERPQKGRYRQFHQLGVETFGFAGAEIDAELITLSAQLWKVLGLSDAVVLHVNTLGNHASRSRFRAALYAYLSQYRQQLDNDSQRRLDTNPLRILDSKDPNTRTILRNAPKSYDYLDAESLAHFDHLKTLLDALEIQYTEDPHLVRGLDYYSQTVFEWITPRLGAQGTICGGGRYDALVEAMGGRATPAMGFAIGLERIVLLLETLESLPAQTQYRIDAMLIAVGDNLSAYALKVSQAIRQAIPGFSVLMHSVANFKLGLKKADKSGAQWVLILGADEQANETISIKSLRQYQPQQTLTLDAVIQLLQSEPQCSV